MSSIARIAYAVAASCLAAGLLIADAAAATQVAQVKDVAGAAFIVRDGQRMAAKQGDPLYEKDVLQTDADGTIGATFTDNTMMSLGPNSEAAIAQYVFDSSNFKGAMETDMNKGTLSMVSGDIARSSPGAMKVRTPTAILGVRGTSFVVEVNK